MKIQLSDHFSYGRLLRFVLPSIVMMIITSIYSVVDGLFVSNYVGTVPFAALNLVYPMLMGLSALGFMMGTGGSALVSKTLGQGDKAKANRYFSMIVYTTLITGIVLAFLAFVFMRPLSVLLGAKGEAMIADCVLYGRINLLALPAFMLQVSFQSFLVTAEKPRLGLVLSLFAGVTNMVLDFLLVGVLRFGLTGAAWATGISQMVGGFLPFLYFLNSKNSSLLHLGKPSLDVKALVITCTNGSSELMSNLASSLVSVLYNFRLMALAGENGVAAYGVIMYVNFIFAAIFMGYAIGSAPVVGYHYGAEHHDELKNLLNKSLRLVAAAALVLTALSELLASTHQVIVMGHKYPDLDVLGAVAGVCAIARKKDVPIKAVRAPSPYPSEEQTKQLASLPEYQGIFIPPDEAIRLAKPTSIVVVVDTNRPEQTQVPELLTSGARIVVIDHHRRAASYIEKPALSFHDPYASSASELVAELVQYILDNGDLKRQEAEAMLAGIVLDTKNFTMRTGSRTFETAAFLRKAGADTALVHKFFQHDLRDTVTKMQIIQGAQTYRGSMAIALTDRPVGRAIAGQAADEMLNIAGIEASFVLFPEAGQAYLSARSGSNVNVQVISEMLGGGGNATTAGAQFPGKTTEDVLPLLKETIDNYFDDEA